MSLENLQDDPQVTAILRRIVACELPAELGDFDLSSRALLEKAERETDVVAGRGDRAPLEFGPSELAALQFAGVVLGTAKALIDLYTVIKKSKSDAIAAKATINWEERLKEEGVSDDLAKRIVDKYQGDFLGVATKT